jgi:hypothetical protein
MIRNGIKRSPYPDKLQARAIELFRLYERGDLKANGLMVALTEEFPRNKRLKNGNLTLKVVRTWAKKRPDLPEIMSGEIKRITTFDEINEAENLHEVVQSAMYSLSAEVINSMFDGKSPPKNDQRPSK